MSMSWQLQCLKNFNPKLYPFADELYTRMLRSDKTVCFLCNARILTTYGIILS